MDNAKDKSLHIVSGASSKIAIAFINRLTEQNPDDLVVSLVRIH